MTIVLYNSTVIFYPGNIIFVTKICLCFACCAFWLTAEDMTFLLFTEMILVCVFWLVQVQCRRLSGSDLLRSVWSTERGSASAAGHPVGGGDGQTDPAGGSSRPGQPLFSSHTAGRHEGPLTFSSSLSSWQMTFYLTILTLSFAIASFYHTILTL